MRRKLHVIYIHTHTHTHINTIRITGLEYYSDHNMNFLSYMPELPFVETGPSGYLCNRVFPRELFWNLARWRILLSGRDELAFFAILLPELFDLNFPLC